MLQKWKVDHQWSPQGTCPSSSSLPLAGWSVARTHWVWQELPCCTASELLFYQTQKSTQTTTETQHNRYLYKTQQVNS